MTRQEPVTFNPSAQMLWFDGDNADQIRDFLGAESHTSDKEGKVYTFKGDKPWKVEKGQVVVKFLATISVMSSEEAGDLLTGRGH